jgi:hypothetical protein
MTRISYDRHAKWRASVRCLLPAVNQSRTRSIAISSHRIATSRPDLQPSSAFRASSAGEDSAADVHVL